MGRRPPTRARDLARANGIRYAYTGNVLRYTTLRLEETAKPATINRELAALRAAYRLGLDNDTIIAMPRLRLLPENNGG